MRVLILGGTRFVGAALAKLLVENGNDVTVSSRRPEGAPSGLKVFGGERMAAISSLAQAPPFDTIIDFTAYNSYSVKHALASFPSARYFFISSIWVTKLHSGMLADSLVPAEISKMVNVPEITRKYLEGKSGAELEVYKAHLSGRRAVVLRFPIVWGINDHTGRLDFYRSRVTDGAEQILVDGGHNYVQLGWRDDLAEALARLVKMKESNVPLLLDGLGDIGVPVKDLNELIAFAEGVKARPISVSREKLTSQLPEYLDREPLWREIGLPVSKVNLFTLTGWRPHAIQSWLTDVIRNIPAGSEMDDHRIKEIEFIKRCIHA
jgi:nucleoside-diphosphate-sugar epimerase